MDCLVTKLKGVVDNNNLVKLGYLKVFMPKELQFTSGNISISGAGFRFKADALGDETLFDVGGTTSKSVDTENTSVTFVHSHDAYYATDVSVSSFIFGVIDLDDILLPSTSVLKVVSGGAYNEEGTFVKSQGSIERLGSLYPNIRMFTATYLNNYVTGDITEAFGKCKKITSISVNNTASITGSIDELAESLLQNNREANTLDVRCNNSITYYDTTQQQNVVVQNNAVKRILFDLANHTYSIIDAA